MIKKLAQKAFPFNKVNEIIDYINDVIDFSKHGEFDQSATVDTSFVTDKKLADKIRKICTSDKIVKLKFIVNNSGNKSYGTVVCFPALYVSAAGNNTYYISFYLSAGKKHISIFCTDTSDEVKYKVG